MEFINPVKDIIKSRKSVRSYSLKHIEPYKLARLNQCIDNISGLPFGTGIRFEIIEKDKNMGTYGFIKEASHYIAGAVKKQERCYEDYGFALEKIILHATDLGLGTCWLGGTFNRQGFAVGLKLRPGEIIPAVSPVGYPSAEKRVMDKIIKTLAGTEWRKNAEQLFFEDNPSNPLDMGSIGKYSQVLEMVRVAPSAVNRQPWRIIKDKNIYHLYVTGRPAKKYDRMGAGIAMAHFQLTARCLELQGEWADLAMMNSVT